MYGDSIGKAQRKVRARTVTFFVFESPGDSVEVRFPSAEPNFFLLELVFIR